MNPGPDLGRLAHASLRKLLGTFGGKNRPYSGDKCHSRRHSFPTNARSIWRRLEPGLEPAARVECQHRDGVCVDDKVLCWLLMFCEGCWRY